MTYYSSILLMALTTAFMMLTNPVMIGFWVLMMALSIAFIFCYTFNSWFAIITFLIYISGMMIMFAYFSALTPNKPLLDFPVMKILFSSYLSFFLFLPSSPSPTLTLASLPLNLYAPMTTLYHNNNMYVILTLVLILFLIMVSIVKITNLNQGPFRPFSYV